MIVKLFKDLNELFNEDWLSVTEPETLTMMLDQAGLKITDESLDLINALKACIITDTPWKNVYVFENVVDAFNGNMVIPDSITKPSLEDICFGVYCMLQIKKNPFSEDIARYIASIAIDTGISWLPPPIDFANPFIPDDDMGTQQECQKLVNRINLLPTDFSYAEAPIEIQAAKLAAIWKVFNRKVGKNIIT